MPRVDLSTFTSAGADEATYLTDNTAYRTLACKAATSALDRTTESGLPLGEIAYRYKDYTANYFEDFTHHFDYCVEDMASTTLGQVFPWMLSDGVGDGFALQTTLVPDSSYDPGHNDSSASIYGSLYAGRLLPVAIDHAAGYVRIRIYKVGTPAAALTVAIVTDDGAGHPNEQAGGLVCSGTLAAADCADTALPGSWQTILMSAANLDNAVTYWILVRSSLGDASNRWVLVLDTDDGDWVSTTDSGATWTHQTLTSIPYEEGSVSNDYDYLSLRQTGNRLEIAECYNGVIYTSATHHHMTEGELIFPKVERVGDQVDVHLYKDPAFATELAIANGDDVDSPLHLDLQADVHYRYCYVMNSYGNNSGNGIVCWTGNLWISGTPPAMFTEESISFILAPEAAGAETFDSMHEGDAISEAEADLTWTVVGSVVATDGAGAGESVSPQGGMSALISCAAGTSYGYFLHGGDATVNFQALGWVRLISIANTGKAGLIAASNATPLIVAAGVEATDATHRYWRIWIYDGGWHTDHSTQTIFQAELGAWYQVMLFQDEWYQASLWVRKYGAAEGDQYYEWTEVESIRGVNGNLTRCNIGTLFNDTSVVQVDDIRYQAGSRSGAHGICHGGAGDGTILWTSPLNKNGVVLRQTFSTTAVTKDPSCWTKRHDLTGANSDTGQVVWDSTNSCWWEFETTGTLGVDAVCDVYQIDTDWTRTHRAQYDPATVGAPGVNNDNLWYIIPSRMIETTGGRAEILCTLVIVDGAAEDATTADTYFIKFNTTHAYNHADHDATTADCWSTPILICDETDGVNLNAAGDDFFPGEAFLWRQPVGGNLICISRMTHLGDDPDHGAAAAHQYQRIFDGGLDGAAWGAGAWPGGDSGMQMDCYSGWLNAFVFRGYLWYQGYDARTASTLSINKNFKSIIALADGEDGALITERHWGWGPANIWNKPFAFWAANGNIDAEDGQSLIYKLSTVFNQGIGFFRLVSTDFDIPRVHGGGNASRLLAAGVL